MGILVLLAIKRFKKQTIIPPDQHLLEIVKNICFGLAMFSTANI